MIWENDPTKKEMITMKKTILKSIRIILGGILMLSLFGCSVNKYEIDYCGAKSSYQGAKSSYEPGVEVKLYYKNFASPGYLY